MYLFLWYRLLGSIWIDVDFKWSDLILLFNENDLNLDMIVYFWEFYHDGFEMIVYYDWFEILYAKDCVLAVI